ncbi:MAG: cupin domain-containing protein [Longicatena sp.]
MENLKMETYENHKGGVGKIHITRLLTNEQLGEHIKMYAKIVIEPNSSIGYHLHDGDSESYYIVSGNGRYNDNGVIRDVHAGEISNTESGQSHGLENIEKEPLVFMALIIKD